MSLFTRYYQSRPYVPGEVEPPPPANGIPVVLDSGLLRSASGSSTRSITIPVHASAIGVVAFLIADVEVGSNTDHQDTGQTLGGNAPSAVLGLAADEAGGEDGTCRGFLWTGAQMPASGNQTLAVPMMGGTTNEFIYIYVNLGPETTQTAIEVLDSDILEEDAANPSITLQYGGVVGLAVAGIFSGRNANQIAPAAGCTELQEGEFDSANRTAAAVAQTTGGASDFAIGWTASNDDVAMVAAALTAV